MLMCWLAGAASIDWSAVGDVSTGDDSAALDEARAIDGLANTGTTSYSIFDLPNMLGAADLTADEIAAIENASGTVTSNGNASAEEASVLASFTHAVVYNVDDADSAALAISTGLDEAVNISATNAATAADEANTIMAAGNSGDTVIDAVSGTAEEILSLAFGDNDVITAITVTGETTVELAEAILALDTGDNIGGITIGEINDTAAAILNGDADALALGTEVYVNDAVSVATWSELVAQGALTNDADVRLTVSDSFTNLMADTDVDGTVDADTLFDIAGTVTVEGDLTVAQADALNTAAADADALSYTISDSDERIADDIDNDRGNVSGASSFTGHNGATLTLETVGGTMYVVGTVAEIGDLASVYQDLNVLFEVELADLEADPDFFATLENNQAFRVTDTAANLGSNNAQLSLATALVATTSATAEEGAAILATAVGVTTYSLEDTAENLAADGDTMNGAVNIVAKQQQPRLRLLRLSMRQIVVRIPSTSKILLQMLKPISQTLQTGMVQAPSPFQALLMTLPTLTLFLQLAGPSLITLTSVSGTTAEVAVTIEPTRRYQNSWKLRA